LEIFESYQGEGPYVGAPQIFVRMGGCHLRCAYCDTPESWTTEGSATWEAPALIEELHRRSAGRFHSISVTGGEPLLQADFLAEVLARKPLPVHLDTSGMLPHRLERIIDFIDVVAMDIKLPSCPGTRADWDEIERTMAVASRREAFVKVVLTRDSTESEIERVARIVRPGVPVFLQPVTPFAGQEPPPHERMARFRAIVEAAGRTVYVVPQIHVLVGWK
jgi:organic radical activating enzyme